MDPSKLFIYGVGAAIILFFLWHAIRQPKPIPANHNESEMDTEVLSEDSVEHEVTDNEEMNTSTRADFSEMHEEVAQAAQEALEEVRSAPEANILPEDQVEDSDWQALIKHTFKQRVKRHEISPNPDSFYDANLAVVNLLAPEGGFTGSEILSVSESQGFGFSDMGVFNAYDEAGHVLFSIASIENPGVFDMENMDDFITRGLSLFVELDMVEEPKTAFRKLLATAHEFQYYLGGDLIDETGAKLTQQSVSNYLHRVHLVGEEATAEA